MMTFGFFYLLPLIVLPLFAFIGKRKSLRTETGTQDQHPEKSKLQSALPYVAWAFLGFILTEFIFFFSQYTSEFFETLEEGAIILVLLGIALGYVVGGKPKYLFWGMCGWLAGILIGGLADLEPGIDWVISGTLTMVFVGVARLIYRNKEKAATD